MDQLEAWSLTELWAGPVQRWVEILFRKGDDLSAFSALALCTKVLPAVATNNDLRQDERLLEDYSFTQI